MKNIEISKRIIASCISLEEKNGLNSRMSKDALQEIYKRGGDTFCVFCEYGNEKINHHNISNCMSCCNYFDSNFKMKTLTITKNIDKILEQCTNFPGSTNYINADLYKNNRLIGNIMIDKLPEI